MPVAPVFPLGIPRLIAACELFHEALAFDPGLRVVAVTLLIGLVALAFNVTYPLDTVK